MGVDPGSEVPVETRNPQQHREYPPVDEVGILAVNIPNLIIHRHKFSELTALDIGLFDAIFIDGDHRYEAVLSDSRQALTLLNPGGWIAWHDVGGTHTPGVLQALLEFDERVTWIKDTWIAYLLD